MATIKYDGINRGEDTRFKVNNNILKMMYANPTLGIGYLIGNALGENYFGKKRAKSSQEANDAQFKGSVGADEKNGVYGTGNKKDGYYKTMNEAMQQYQGNGGKVLYEGRTTATPDGVVVDTEKGIYPRTPQQNNQSGITIGNVGNGGGVTSVADAWNKMNNGSTYNYGGTPIANPTGPRNLDNVISDDVLGLKQNGAYFPMNSPAPAPMSYTPEQLAQIQAYGKFSPEELQRMGAGQLATPSAPAESGDGSGLLGAIVDVAAQAAAADEAANTPAPQNPQNAPNADQLRLLKGDNTVWNQAGPREIARLRRTYINEPTVNDEYVDDFDYNYIPLDAKTMARIRRNS